MESLQFIIYTYCIDPQWWKYLPNLKPIGLNAMLTYSPLEGKSSSSAASAQLNTSIPMNTKQSQSTVSTNIPSIQTLNQLKQSSKQSKKLNKRNNVNDSYIEKSLVNHIRESIPLESLRELAEEIGLTEKTDCAIFHKVLEMNVIAPGLIDAKCSSKKRLPQRN